jgi:hypothetical protein
MNMSWNAVTALVAVLGVACSLGFGAMWVGAQEQKLDSHVDSPMHAGTVKELKEIRSDVSDMKSDLAAVRALLEREARRERFRQ